MLSTTKKQKTQASVPRKAQRSQDDVKATQTMIVFVCTNHTFLDCKKANKNRIELVTRDILTVAFLGWTELEHFLDKAFFAFPNSS